MIINNFFNSLNIEKALLIKAALTLLSLILYLTFSFLINSIITKYGLKKKFINKRVIFVKKKLGFLTFVLFLFILLIIWGIDFKGLVVFASSFFAVIGIAFFASWSILSNITSGVIMFFSFPYKKGDKIKFGLGDTSYEGIILEMGLFNIKIEDKDKNLIFYPNNLIIQNPITKLKKKV